MTLDWDPAKRQANLAKHGVDFAAVEDLDWSRAIARASLGAAEPRLLVLAPIGDRLHALVFSLERAAVRVISLRKANTREIRIWMSET